ncbi:NADP-dependent phosphogluconate dehydrogenase [Mucilaginibacter defluvii]|uniref:6-phosphogluconate dehydrogenase, decarboxylating n=1 Tax=Mucilaginibacter defluvii TaxID=1196019 RepID=A0ABP9G0K4_9SPHI
MAQYDFGIVGLGVMGRNLLLNVADHGFAAAGLDVDGEKASAFEKAAKEGQQVKGTTSAEEFAGSIKTPRAIMLLVPAGKPVDAAIQTLLPFLEKGDIVIDGGNSYFPDTDRRVAELEEKGIHFFGMGISGGEKGARFGPSMMPGGDKNAYERLRPVFEAIAAKVDGEPCVAYLGNGSAGNYVKMAHNGIEYALMQLISESYDLLKRGLGFEDAELQPIFEEWNNTELKSFLIEITSDILKKKDEGSDELLVNFVSDRARSKGTGKWTSQDAMNLQVPVPVIDAAVTMRDLSAYKTERVKAAELLKVAPTEIGAVDKQKFVAQLKNAYYFAMINTYAQGLAQLFVASKEYNYELKLEEVAKIWRGGCIIRALCLEDFRKAFQKQPDLPNILLDEEIGATLLAKQGDTRDIIKIAIDKGIPLPAFMASLSYFDGYRSATLPTNLVQAQRDYFGAHQYERTDREGVFHTEWK